MTSYIDDEYRAELVEAIETVLWDHVYEDTHEGRELAARLIVQALEATLLRMGWRPPAALTEIRNWALRTGQIPDHHKRDPDVLHSHLNELADILNRWKWEPDATQAASQENHPHHSP